jgi:CRP/FNR family cyclic AMP-dependent transcriptional regulator
MAFASKPPPAPTNLLTDLPDRLSGALLAGAAQRHLAPGEMLFLAGDPGDGFYRVEKGLLKISIASASGAERILAILGPGSIVGDLAIIDGKPRSASVSALRDCTVQYVSRKAFDAFAAKSPEIYHYLAKVLAARLRDTD